MLLSIKNLIILIYLSFTALKYVDAIGKNPNLFANVSLHHKAAYIFNIFIFFVLLNPELFINSFTCFGNVISLWVGAP